MHSRYSNVFLFTNMKNATDYFPSILLGVTIIISVSGIPSEVFGHARTSFIFGTSIMILLTCVSAWNTFRKNIKPSWPNILYLCVLSLYLIDFKHPGSLFNTGSFCLLLLYATLICLRQIHYTIIFNSCLCAAVLLAGWGYLQYFKCIPSNSPFFLLTGPFHNPAILAIMLSLLLGIMLNGLILFYSSLKKSRFFHVIVITAIIFCLPVLALTYARAACISLFISILYCLYIRFPHPFCTKNVIRFGGILLFIVLSAGASYFLKPKSADGRLLIWKVSWRMIKDAPLTGFGKGGFAANYLYYQAEYMKSSTSAEERKLAGDTHLAFNEPLRITVEHGAVGLLIYLAFIIRMLLPPKESHLVTLACKSLLTGVVTWGLFGYPDQIFPLLTLSVIGIACILNKNEKHVHTTNSVKNKVAAITLCCFATFLLSGRLWGQWQPYHNLYTCFKKNTKRNVGCPNSILQFKDRLKDDIGFCYYYCQSVQKEHPDTDLHMIRFLEKNFPTPGLLMIKGDCLKKKNQWKEAENAYKLAADMMPSLQAPRGKLAFLYNETGRRKEALAIAHEILTEDVKVYGFDTFRLHRELKRIFEDEFK